MSTRFSNVWILTVDGLSAETVQRVIVPDAVERLPAPRVDNEGALQSLMGEDRAGARVVELASNLLPGRAVEMLKKEDAGPVLVLWPDAVDAGEAARCLTAGAAGCLVWSQVADSWRNRAGLAAEAGGSLEERFLRSQRMEAIGALAGGVAHDFNNILAPITMAASILQMEMPAEERQLALRTIEDSARRGAEVVKRLLTFARGMEGERAPQDPIALVKEVARIIELGFPRRVELRVQTSPDLPAILADATQVHQVLLNLCVNARDAMDGRGVLTLDVGRAEFSMEALPPVKYARSGSFVRFRVRDTGEGIAPDVMENLFVPFFSTKPSHCGTGLGLSTSLSIVRNHGGFIAVDSKPGEGACFDVFLPVVPAEVSVAVESAPMRRGGDPARGETVLVLDDERAVRDVSCRFLEKWGYVALSAANGAEALNLIAQKKEIDIVLTDVVMPRMDGVQFVREARRIRGGLPVIAMTGNIEQGARDQLRELGVTVVVEKPFQAETLLRAIESVIRPLKRARRSI